MTTWDKALEINAADTDSQREGVVCSKELSFTTVAVKDPTRNWETTSHEKRPPELRLDQLSSSQLRL
jgi:hypothetical protein